MNGNNEHNTGGRETISSNAKKSCAQQNTVVSQNNQGNENVGFPRQNGSGSRNVYYGNNNRYGGGQRPFVPRGGTLLVGIAGGTGSGKSTFTRELMYRFKGNVTVLTHDNYYKAHHDMPLEERELINYDEPAAYDTELLVEHLKLLKNGQSVECPVYDFTIHDRSEETVTVKPNKVIIVEGILIFADEALCSLLDVRIFIDTDADVRLIRRIRRDTKRRGRTLDSVLDQYMTTVKPMHEKYVDPSRKKADMILPDGGRNLVALDMLFSRIKRHIDDCRYHSGQNHKKEQYKKPHSGGGTDTQSSDVGGE